MRTTKNLTVSLPPAMLREMERVANRESRTLSELVREDFRRSQQPQLDVYKAIREMAPPPAELRAMWSEAKRKGTDTLTSVQIDREVRAVRRRHNEKQAIKRARQ
jgi:Arc/MetJ-type ribon-helix-helix transcriptional regulator